MSDTTKLSSEEKEFNVTYNFLMTCETRNLTMKATSAEEALRKCQEALSDGFIDAIKFRALGGCNDREGWRSCPETSFEFTIDSGGIDDPREK